MRERGRTHKAQVIGRRAKKRANKTGAETRPRGASAPAPAPTKKAKRRPSQTSAITLTCPKGQYASIMAEIRAKIKLAGVGIAGTLNISTGATGAMMIEIPGADNAHKMDALATKMRQVLEGREGVRVDRPVKTAEIGVRGLELSIRPAEVVEALIAKGRCRQTDIQSGDIRDIERGWGSLWVRLPLVTARKASEGGSIQIGWTRA